MEDLIDTSTDLPVRPTGRSSIPKIIPAVVCLLGIIGILIAGKLVPQPLPDFSAGAGVDPVAAEEAFLSSGSNEDLYALVLSLCYHDQQDSAGGYAEKLALYATQMTDRAKEGILDLETIGERSVTEDVLIRVSSLKNE